MVHLSCGDADFDILALSAADFPELPEVEEKYSVSLPEKTLRSMIQQTSFAVSTNEARPVHMGELFEIGDNGLTVVAVDGFRLALRREPLERIEGGAFSFVAPGAALNEVEKICEDIDAFATITLGQRHILFEMGETELICRRLEGEFLDYKNAIPRRNPISVTVDTKAMLESLDRVSVVISEKLKSPVRCIFEQDRVLLSAKTANGDAKDICRIDGDGQGLEIGFNNRYLMDALRFAPADELKLELNTGISPAILVPTDGEESFLYMAASRPSQGTIKEKRSPYDRSSHHHRVYQAAGHLMKLANLVSTGGEAKLRILNEEVTVNSEVCTMRGKKLRPGDVVSFAGRELTVEYAT